MPVILILPDGRAVPNNAERNRAQKQLEDETKARFEAIQKDAAKGK